MVKFQLLGRAPNLGDQIVSSSGLLLQTACDICNVSHMSCEGWRLKSTCADLCEIAVSCYPIEKITGEAKVTQNGDSKTPDVTEY